MSAPITLNGRLGADPEYRTSANGTPVTSLRVVTSRRKKVGEEWQDADTTWWQVTAFRQTAETAATFVKGQRVIIVGRAVESTWETKEGEKRSRIEVIADDVAAVPKASKPEPTTAGDDPWSTETPF